MYALLPTILLAMPAADTPQQSWGKAGVSLDTYRTDAQLCASRGWNADVADSEAVEVFRFATRQIDELSDGAASAASPTTPPGEVDPVLLARQVRIGRIVEATRPRERFAEVRALQLGTVARCLTERGYVRFELTPAQRKALARLKHGSDARRAYLHRLASDPAVLAAQRVAAS